jgi:hypothetical protein
MPTHYLSIMGSSSPTALVIDLESKSVGGASYLRNAACVRINN